MTRRKRARRMRFLWRQQRGTLAVFLTLVCLVVLMDTCERKGNRLKSWFYDNGIHRVLESAIYAPVRLTRAAGMARGLECGTIRRRRPT